MAEPTVKGTGNIPFKKVGHTVGSKYGTDPMKKERGPSNPTEIMFGSSTK
jgi:hypothetical protein